MPARPAAIEGAGLGVPHRSHCWARPEITAAGSVFAFRKRLDGGYSIARRNANTAEITPDHFRLLSDFLPRLHQQPARDPPADRQAVMGGTADAAALGAGRAHAVRGRARAGSRAQAGHPGRGAHRADEAFPAFASMEVAESWGGLIDVTPDAVPVIDQVTICRASSSPPAFPAMGSALARAPDG